jgi:cysteinyl-tRNA synthetase
MTQDLYIYNTLSRKKEKFIPLHAGHVGLYVCGPTVYSDTHLGHSRPNITFDLLYRYLLHLGYKVRYVRNVTDVGHLENDADEGEDKIAKKAKLDQLEPMEVVQYYLLRFRANMATLNVLPPSIEPFASGHIIEQQLMIQKILDKGYAYIANGSVYFDIEAYSKNHSYGKLSGRVIEELLSNTRELAGQSEKKNPNDFAIWKKADPEHIMHWPSTWSEGFPGWHLECSAMSTKYLGETFDIHGGGMDLLFPHHECEIAQSVAATGHEAVRYWMHNNMITINGQKMARSLGNFITLFDLFSGKNPLLDQAYSPMTIRFFILQAHYRGTVDFSNEALKGAEKGLERLIAGIKAIDKIKPEKKSSLNVEDFRKRCYEALNDDLNSPILIAELFEGVKFINSCVDGKEGLNETDIKSMMELYNTFVFDILGLKAEDTGSENTELVDGLVNFLIDLRKKAKANKDFATSDQIRNHLGELGVEVKDTKDGMQWSLK